MFEIEYKGANAVIITTKKTKVVIDPKLSLVGGGDISIRDSVEVLTDARFGVENTSRKLLIEGPGEYEVSDVTVTGIPARRHIDNEDQGFGATIYRLVASDIRVAIIGNIAPKLSDDQLEALGVIDLVIIPIGGGGYTLDASDATTIVRQIDPKAVVPVHYADPNLKYEVPQENMDAFVGELSVGVIEAGPKFKLKGSAGIPEQLSIVKVTRS